MISSKALGKIDWFNYLPAMYCGMLLSEQGKYIPTVFNPGWSGIEQHLGWCISEECERVYYWLDTASGWVCIQSYTIKFSISKIAAKFHSWDNKKVAQFLSLVRDKRSEFLAPISFALEDWDGNVTPKVFP